MSVSAIRPRLSIIVSPAFQNGVCWGLTWLPGFYHLRPPSSPPQHNPHNIDDTPAKHFCVSLMSGSVFCLCLMPPSSVATIQNIDCLLLFPNHTLEPWCMEFTSVPNVAYQKTFIYLCLYGVYWFVYTGLQYVSGPGEAKPLARMWQSDPKQFSAGYFCSNWLPCRK